MVEGWIMPILEFYCPHNHRIYQFLARRADLVGRVPRCPDDPAWPLVREYSPFAVTGRHREEPKPGAGPEAVDDPRLDAAMAELERDFAGMDDEHPDPRQLAHLMQRMATMTGEKMPPVMEEMVRRLEGGEDPEKLEEEYGSALDEPLPGDGDGPDGGGPPETAGTRWRGLLRRRAPSRDGRLFDLAEHL